MNLLEKKMVDLLRRIRGEYGAVGVKAEFEAEGTRTEELMRLKEIALHANVTLTLKVGGCEAVRDIVDARNVGVDHMVGPMIESAFALRKFVESVESVYSAEEREELELLINVETIDTIKSLDSLYDSKAFSRLDGIVLGRGDLVESLGLPRNAVDCDECLTHARTAIGRAKALGKTTVMGGNITVNTLDFIRKLPADTLDRYETRKVCFSTQDALRNHPADGIGIALDFELMWLENKHNHYMAISEEDTNRINALRARKAV